jgi:hypothetical protein
MISTRSVLVVASGLSTRTDDIGHVETSLSMGQMPWRYSRQDVCGLHFSRQAGHPFHGKPNTDSMANRPPGPAQTGQQFRFKLGSLKRPERA